MPVIDAKRSDLIEFEDKPLGQMDTMDSFALKQSLLYLNHVNVFPSPYPPPPPGPPLLG